MPASVNSSRVDQITRCMDELEGARARIKAAPTPIRKMDNLLGEMDWLWELHRLLWEE